MFEEKMWILANLNKKGSLKCFCFNTKLVLLALSNSGAYICISSRESTEDPVVPEVVNSCLKKAMIKQSHLQLLEFPWSKLRLDPNTETSRRVPPTREFRV